MEKCIYLAYGSNLHPYRLKQRLGTVKSVGEYKLKEYKLNFNKKSTDGSGKCTIEHTKNKTDVVYCFLYEIACSQRQELDEIEGLGKGYDQNSIPVSIDGIEHSALTYIASPDYINDNLEPYDWYKEIVLEGAKYHKFPEAYIAAISSTKSLIDKCARRAANRKKTLQEMRNYSLNQSTSP